MWDVMGDGGGLAEAKLLGPTKDTTAALLQRMAARLILCHLRWLTLSQACGLRVAMHT
jgi:hypothetical protein